MRVQSQNCKKKTTKDRCRRIESFSYEHHSYGLAAYAVGLLRATRESIASMSLVISTKPALWKRS
jgi:hypothetical protein